LESFYSCFQQEAFLWLLAWGATKVLLPANAPLVIQCHRILTRDSSYYVSASFLSATVERVSPSRHALRFPALKSQIVFPVSFCDFFMLPKPSVWVVVIHMYFF
jgi:hypothetical protein